MCSWSSEHSSTEMVCHSSFQVIAYFSAEIIGGEVGGGGLRSGPRDQGRGARRAGREGSALAASAQAAISRPQGTSFTSTSTRVAREPGPGKPRPVAEMRSLAVCASPGTHPLPAPSINI